MHCVGLGCHVVIGVGRLVVRSHHAYVISSFLHVVVQLYLVIVNSNCSHNYCLLHIAKTGSFAVFFFTVAAPHSVRPSFPQRVSDKKITNITFFLFRYVLSVNATIHALVTCVTCMTQSIIHHLVSRPSLDHVFSLSSLHVICLWVSCWRRLVFCLLMYGCVSLCVSACCFVVFHRSLVCIMDVSNRKIQTHILQTRNAQ